MTPRKIRKDLTDEQYRAWIESYKNRNRHSVKFPDDLEADYQQWKCWYHMNDNAALRHFVSTHPDLKTKPQNND